MRLKTKLTLALILMWLGLFLLGAWAAFHARSLVTEERQAAVRHAQRISVTYWRRLRW